MNVKLLSASLSSLLVTNTKAFVPTTSIKRATCHKAFCTTIALKRSQSSFDDSRRWGGGGSYLGSLSNLSSGPQSTSAPAFSTASSSSSPAVTAAITKMNLELADALSNAVIAAAKRNRFPPIVVTVLDESANALVQKRMDGNIHAAFPEFSYAKAYTCVTMNVPSREFRDKYTRDGDAAKIAQLNSMMAITGKMAAFPGGVVVRNANGEVVGAIGVSGAAGDEDEYAALRGVWDSGLPLTTMPVEHSCTTALE